jgi:YD repeat-containing protein
MGITVYSTDLDPQGNAIGGSGLNQAVRWLEGSGYERFGYFLPEAVYFTWQWQQGKAESLVIYDAAGRELRNVSFGLTLNDTIYVDTRYDTQGRVNEVTDPYFVDDGPFSVGKTCFEYDNYDRPTQTTIYDKNGGVLSVTQKSYFGLETTTTNYRSNNNKEKVSDGLNIMGWKTGHLDFLDPDDVFNPASQVLVQYDYYADGKLAWAKTTSNGNSSNDDTKMTMQYDALGNRTRLADPDYGTVDSHYDAFGRLCWTASPKGDTTAYEYDGLGRLIVRSETDHVDNTSVITRWYYSDDEGRKGLLDSIWYDGGQQVVHYSYDTLNRVIQVTETRGNQNYSTSYE